MLKKGSLNAARLLEKPYGDVTYGLLTKTVYSFIVITDVSEEQTASTFKLKTLLSLTKVSSVTP
jgi:hypothetical protein